MDFLDSFDVDISKYKKSRRVRSWYLYEQFKSLERNQLDATRKLKNRSYQDRILRQELCERKARRNLYDQFGHSQSDCGIEPSIKSQSTKTSLDVGSDDFFESFHELKDDEELTKMGDQVDDLTDESVKFREDEFKSVEDDQSYSESVVNIPSEETLTEDIKNCLETEMQSKEHMPPHLELNFNVVKEKLQCLEKLAQMRGMCDKFSEKDSLEDDELKHIIMQDKNVNTSDNNLFFMWSKLVSFAYQIMELNHGNCYYDYGSQFLTAVLACDVLRRGINRMCHYLQPYVSPLKFNTDSDSSDKNYKNVEQKRQQRYKYFRNNHHYKKRNSKNVLNATAKRYCSCHIHEHENTKKYRRYSEPERPISTRRNPSTSYTIWPCYSSEDHKLCVKTCTRCCHKVVNPMLHISRRLDKIMRDDCNPRIV